jgi:hypothetical protein
VNGYLGSDLVIGGLAGFQLRGEIAEIVAIRDVLHEDDLKSIERGLIEKYAL